ncbi:MAG: peptidoglycan DD-metalloendopeptidase family protein [Desulfopila sp.]|jgi:hypothetical protein|nr:peptidoglycan DD-metalloendopeptidase family protein [Desulfopila sp.]
MTFYEIVNVIIVGKEMDTPFQYFHYLELCNPNLQGAKEYILYPGMEFGSREKWWPDSGMRPTAHEGIDICYYRDAAGEERTLPLTSNLTVMASGRVVAICRDFLGYSLFLDHEYEDELRFLSVYAHIAPHNSIAAGQYLHPGDSIGSIADTTGRKNRMVAHLHVTLMQVERFVSAEKYDWDLINRSPYSRLIDPLQMTAAEKIVRRPVNPHKEKGMQQ